MHFLTCSSFHYWGKCAKTKFFFSGPTAESKVKLTLINLGMSTTHGTYFPVSEFKSLTNYHGRLWGLNISRLADVNIPLVDQPRIPCDCQGWLINRIVRAIQRDIRAQFGEKRNLYSRLYYKYIKNLIQNRTLTCNYFNIWLTVTYCLHFPLDSYLLSKTQDYLLLLYSHSLRVSTFSSISPFMSVLLCENGIKQPSI